MRKLYRQDTALINMRLLLMAFLCGWVGAVTHEALQQHNAPEVTEHQSAPNTSTGLPADQPLQVALGQTLVLPCLLPYLPTSLHAVRVYWSTKDNSQVEKIHKRRVEVVHVFNKGQEEFTHQSSAYHNRTRLFTNQLQFGNFSLELRNVSEHDNLTTFQCLALYDGIIGPKFLNNVSLLILHKEDRERPGAPTTDWKLYCYISIPVAVCVFVVMLGFCLAARNKLKCSPLHNNADPERGEEKQGEEREEENGVEEGKEGEEENRREGRREGDEKAGEERRKGEQEESGGDQGQLNGSATMNQSNGPTMKNQQSGLSEKNQQQQNGLLPENQQHQHQQQQQQQSGSAESTAAPEQEPLLSNGHSRGEDGRGGQSDQNRALSKQETCL
ncbi:uncharacterized protein LOC143100072 [Alosa pseudoharengus]|uniref:uncharacterized protein LOC143100072 n=1 Tax=Alosa pseudoharengus TaxID=34774 RepID=UPI003F8CD6A4